MFQEWLTWKNQEIFQSSPFVEQVFNTIHWHFYIFLDKPRKSKINRYQNKKSFMSYVANFSK